ncbi:nucleocapsid protein [Plecomyxo virus]|nr:nucleocapsid protein [Plecomyxo virus]
MASITAAIQDFRDFKNKAPKGGIIGTALSGIKKKIVVLVPSRDSPELRWLLTVLSLQLVWSGISPGSVITGAFFTLLTIFAEQPAQMLRTVGNDPDIEAQIVEVVLTKEKTIKLSSRGMDMTKQENRYREIAATPPDDAEDINPFQKIRASEVVIRTTEQLQNALATITLQIWILLTKAVTAPDTARSSENKRWIKYLQQKRAHDEFRLKNKWLDIARNRIAEDISIRRLMVEILVEIGKVQGTKSRILEMIADVGNYIAETGMAGFHLTIKFGLETRYPALALNEFQSDLSTIIQLMKLYKEQGDRAPYLVILEESVQTKFSPGNYPLLWSYAMGIGTTIDRAMTGLQYDRPYIEPNFFKLGQDVVNKLEGNVDRKMAQELDLSDEQILTLKEIAQGNYEERNMNPGSGRVSKFVPAAVDLTEEEEQIERPTTSDKGRLIPPEIIPRRNLPSTFESEKPKLTDEERSAFRKKLDEMAGNIRAKQTFATKSINNVADSQGSVSDLELIKE